MRLSSALVAGLLLAGAAAALPPAEQIPLQPEASTLAGGSGGGAQAAARPRALRGRFLHITDLHPDPFYRAHASTDGEHACHGGHGAAGVYGAETSSCDSPVALINATFDWLAAHVRDEVDFVVWTGDSARHDNDERHPRTERQITELNALAAGKMREVFGNGARDDAAAVPVVPTWGNNDVLPHNVFFGGPNRWTRRFLDVWRAFVPEEQRHGFAAGGWFYVEVVPNHLAVFSLN